MKTLLMTIGLALLISVGLKAQNNSGNPVLAEPTTLDEPQIFAFVENMPVFPGGEKELIKFLQQNVVYPTLERDMGKQGKVLVRFVVDTNGAVTNVTISKGVTPGFDHEALRVVKMLPNFKPGTQQGRKVNVYYMLPIDFRLAVDTAVKHIKEEDVVSDAVAKDEPQTGSRIFNIVEEMPQFPGGEKALVKFLQENITYPAMERDADIQGRVLVRFVVDTDGSVTDVTVLKRVSPGLDKEAVRVVKILPKFKPGRQQGKAVKVYYTLPISFKFDNTDDYLLQKIQANYGGDKNALSGITEYKKGNYGIALKSFTKFIDKMKDKDGKVYAIMAECYKKMGDQKNRCAMLEKAVQFDYKYAAEDLKKECK